MGNCSHQEVFICISMYDILIKSQRQLTQKRLLWTNLCGLLVTDRKCAGNGSGNGKIIKWKLVSRYQFSQEWRINNYFRNSPEHTDITHEYIERLWEEIK